MCQFGGSVIAKLSDSESETAETQVWLEFAVKCNYLNRDAGAQLYSECDEVIRMLVAMINSPQTWIIESN